MTLNVFRFSLSLVPGLSFFGSAIGSSYSILRHGDSCSLRPVRVEAARGIDFLWCHAARDVAHLLADVVAPRAGREGLELGAQIDRRLSFEPRRAGLAVDFTVAGSTWGDAAQRCPAGDDARRFAGGRLGSRDARQIGVICLCRS